MTTTLVNAIVAFESPNASALNNAQAVDLVRSSWD